MNLYLEAQIVSDAYLNLLKKEHRADKFVVHKSTRRFTIFYKLHGAWPRLRIRSNQLTVVGH